MAQPVIPQDARSMASEFDAEVRALAHRNIPNVQKISRRYAQRLKDHPPVSWSIIPPTETTEIRILREFGFVNHP